MLTSIEPPTKITDRWGGPFHTLIHIAHMATRSGLISSGRRHSTIEEYNKKEKNRCVIHCSRQGAQ